MSDGKFGGATSHRRFLCIKCEPKNKFTEYSELKPMSNATVYL